MKVSFIIPIYNVEKYLPQCVDSILSQTYTDFEVILVDDGSPDNSGKLCDEYALKDKRVRVIHKPNGGLSDARNAGLKEARGEWVVFIDSDDFWVNDDCLKQIMTVVEKHGECGFIGFNCSYYYEDNHSYVPWVAYDDSIGHPIDKDTAMHALVTSGTMPMSACLKVISRKMLQENRLYFKNGLLSEDIPWFIDLLEGCGKCMFVNQYIYAYRQNRVGSITHTAGERSVNSLLYIIQEELNKMNHRTFSEQAKDDVRSFLAYEVCILLAMISSLPAAIQHEKRREVYKYKWLLAYTSNPKVKKAALINKLFGIRVTEWVLAFYLNRVKK